ncbi:transporter, major facilitator superfamily superfamily protein [Acanthamoeba castellanii str. Neff]|uniref:Transporter, major facilitator superfamily superfamily protein n=1 Tax=Acanthamoeba castellanii (strain ATCC 30010 / Neff) TaxID=1257118 RepID=L8HE38_ACACF|nr:transporter, major facilitator superfamily superfamily protein [Acanthamoeba castellanii str. Neff]ELR23023.1 transporter, major facilitator superfamily superfamily protein [Acanthamoeba castellanii str. Neff]
MAARTALEDNSPVTQPDVALTTFASSGLLLADDDAAPPNGVDRIDDNDVEDSKSTSTAKGKDVTTPQSTTSPTEGAEDAPETRKERAWRGIRSAGRIALTGTAFGADAYLLQVTSMVIPIMAEVYPQTDTDASLVSTAALLGAMLGQLLFGFIADMVGRRIGFAITIGVFTLGAIASSAVGNRAVVYYLLALFRLVVGFGVGGEYPLAASIASENAEDANQKRGRAVAFTFAMQGVGALAVPLVALLLLIWSSDLDLVWRLCLGLGAVPGLVTLPFRLTMAETGQFKAAQSRERLRGSRSLWRRVQWRWVVLKRYWRELIGTTLTWLLFDALFYGNTLFTPTLLDSMGMADGDTPRARLQNLAELSLIIAAIALPGYVVAVLLIDRIGRRYMQLQGFLLMALIYAVISTFYDDISDITPLFLLLYGATYFFASFGPKMTTFVIPSELYPTEVRAFCHGISAAAGKLGAIIGTYAFKYILSASGVAVVLNICAMIAVVGLFVTTLFTPETRLLRLAHAPSMSAQAPPDHIRAMWAGHDAAAADDDDDDESDMLDDSLPVSSADSLDTSGGPGPRTDSDERGGTELRELEGV